jgi:hypothetical protein
MERLTLCRTAMLRQNAELRIRLLRSQMTIEELHDDIVSVSGFWNVGIVKETVEKSLPDVQFRVDTELHEPRVSVNCRTHFKRPGAGDYQSRRKLCEYFRRIDGRHQRIVRIDTAEIA